MTGPDQLRARFARHTRAALVADLAALRPRAGDVPAYATRIALCELGRRAEFLDAQLARLDALIVPLITTHAPGLLAVYGVASTPRPCCSSPQAISPHGCAPRPAGAHLCAVAPIPASSGKITRHRLNHGGDRNANHALWRIVITRMSAHPATLTYLDGRTKEGLSKKEIIPLPEALRRPRGLRPPPPRRELKPPDPGDGLTHYSATPSMLPSNDSSTAPGPNLTPLGGTSYELGLHREWLNPVLSGPQQPSPSQHE